MYVIYSLTSMHSPLVISRWEVPIDAVFLDGKQLADTKLTGTSPQLSGLIDTVSLITST